MRSRDWLGQERVGLPGNILSVPLGLFVMSPVVSTRETSAPAHRFHFAPLAFPLPPPYPEFFAEYRLSSPIRA